MQRGWRRVAGTGGACSCAACPAAYSMQCRLAAKAPAPPLFPYTARACVSMLYGSPLPHEIHPSYACAICDVPCACLRPQHEIMVTAGANQAFVNVLLALCDETDRVVLFAPYYFNHLMAIQMSGGARRVVFGECFAV